MKDVFSQVKKYLEKSRLRLNLQKRYILKNDIGVELLGQRVYATHRLLKKKNIQRFCVMLHTFCQFKEQLVIDKFKEKHNEA